MKSLVFGLALMCMVVSTTIHAHTRTFTCQEIRTLATAYGAIALVEYARRSGYTEKQIAHYRKCLKRGNK